MEEKKNDLKGDAYNPDEEELMRYERRYGQDDQEEVEQKG